MTSDTPLANAVLLCVLCDCFPLAGQGHLSIKHASSRLSFTSATVLARGLSNQIDPGSLALDIREQFCSEHQACSLLEEHPAAIFARGQSHCFSKSLLLGRHCCETGCWGHAVLDDEALSLDSRCIVKKPSCLAISMGPQIAMIAFPALPKAVHELDQQAASMMVPGVDGKGQSDGATCLKLQHSGQLLWPRGLSS